MSSVVKFTNVSVGDPFIITDPDQKKAADEQDNQEAELISETIMKAEQQAEQIVSVATNRAEKAIADANQKAKKILEDAKKNGYEQGFDQGSNDGYNEGYNQGMKEIQCKADELLDESRQLCQLAQEEFNSVLQKAEPEIVNIILAVCSNIIGDEIDSRPDKISSMVKKVLSENSNTESVIVKLAPEDYDAVQENLDTILKYSAYSGKVDLKKDVSIEKGNFTVETPVGNVDAGIRIQLELLERTFYNLIG